VLGGRTHSCSHKSAGRLRVIGGVSVIGLHNCMLILPLRGSCGGYVGVGVIAGPTCSGGSVLRR